MIDNISFYLFTLRPKLTFNKNSQLNYESLQREADFRFSLVRIRENAESIAFYAGEAVEKGDTNRKFNRVVDNM